MEISRQRNLYGGRDLHLHIAPGFPSDTGASPKQIQAIENSVISLSLSFTIYVRFDEVSLKRWSFTNKAPQI